MNLKANYQKFKKHLKTGGLFYALWRGIKYFVFLIKLQRDRFKQSPKNTVIKGRLKIVCGKGGINIFWNDLETTKGPGLNIGINTLGLWTDSTKADWHILERGIDYFKVKIIFKDLPLNQIWSIKLKEEDQIIWQIDTEIEEWLRIDEFRIVCLVNFRYKTWINNYQQADFPRLDDNWHDLCLENSFASLIGVRFLAEGEFLPSFTIETQNNPFPFIQNPPLNNNSHIIGFRFILPEEKKEFFPGHYHTFYGTINLYEDDYPLDKKVEDLRRFSVDEMIKQRINLNPMIWLLLFKGGF